MKVSEASCAELLGELISRFKVKFGEISFPVDGGKPGNVRIVHKKLDIKLMCDDRDKCIDDGCG